MAVNYSSTLKTNRMQLVADLIASKTVVASSGTASAGTIVVGTSALSGATGVLASFTLPATPGTVSGAVFTISGTPLTATAGATGTASLAEIRNNAGTVIVSGLTVGLSSASPTPDIIINATAISTGQSVTLTSGTLTHG